MINLIAKGEERRGSVHLRVRWSFLKYGQKSGWELFLDETERVVPWSGLLSLVRPHYAVAGNGRHTVGVELCCGRTSCSSGLTCPARLLPKLIDGSNLSKTHTAELPMTSEFEDDFAEQGLMIESTTTTSQGLTCYNLVPIPGESHTMIISPGSLDETTPDEPVPNEPTSVAKIKPAQ